MGISKSVGQNGDILLQCDSCYGNLQILADNSLYCAHCHRNAGNAQPMDAYCAKHGVRLSVKGVRLGYCEDCDGFPSLPGSVYWRY